jgi:glutathione S-transferase
MTLPRPDLSERLGIAYRRIPLLAIDGDVYCDTRLIIARLNELFPYQKDESIAAPSTPEEVALSRLFEVFSTDSMFAMASALLPTHLPIFKDQKFVADRSGLTGSSWNAGAVDKRRPKALLEFRRAFELIEPLLSDGRTWLCKGSGSKPSLVDLEAVWPLHWITKIPGSLPAEVICQKTYPNTYAWIGRFDKATKVAKAAVPKPEQVSGATAASLVSQAALARTTSQNAFDKNDPTGLNIGEQVIVNPTDSGFTHRDRGRLVGLDKNEVVIELNNPVSQGGPVRLHFPRHGFRVVSASQESGKL